MNSWYYARFYKDLKKISQQQKSSQKNFIRLSLTINKVFLHRDNVWYQKFTIEGPTLDSTVCVTIIIIIIKFYNTYLSTMA